ncbi:hypothetical protein [Peribacillus frigoritolerans]|uniref:hypothetical protein n=1 Tax=Peribacillus frigoritolerans TaxID=450367 RepID=UPI0033057370
MVHDAVGRRLHLCSAANWGKSNIGLFFLCLKARLSEQKEQFNETYLKGGEGEGENRLYYAGGEKKKMDSIAISLMAIPLVFFLGFIHFCNKVIAKGA